MNPTLRIQRFTNPGYPHAMDAVIQGGRIASIQPHQDLADDDATSIDARGRLLLPGLIEPHIHLDKAFLLPHMKEDVSSIAEAIASTAVLKRSFTKTDIAERAKQTLYQAIANGVTHMRCHVEIDPIVRLLGMEVMLELKAQFQDRITLQIVAFPQEGIAKQPGTEELLRQAMALGADAIGGITYQDEDVEMHLRTVFNLAREFGTPIDLHADFSDDPQMLAIRTIIHMTEAYGLQGRVSVGHLTSLGSLPPAQAEPICQAIAKAAIHVMTLPATDLYLNGRNDTHRLRRGLTPVAMLLKQGANVIYGSNNIQNPFTPFGTADPLDTGLLLAQTAHMGSKTDALTLLDMATTRAANALGIRNYGLRVGADADLVLFEATDPRSALYERAPRSFVWKRGQLVASTSKTTAFYPVQH
ncbi:cytosine deaminase [Paenibacillus whitsoniae]|uniref:Cytosine deaminase n=2 Tax=Paenibacillus whitsoniae TaxID=2496558 RepID=A0A430J8I7_9BACL|nr:cytosine deaminase [Paenibacillus whitsoniae]